MGKQIDVSRWRLSGAIFSRFGYINILLRSIKLIGKCPRLVTKLLQTLVVFAPARRFDKFVKSIAGLSDPEQMERLLRFFASDIATWDPRLLGLLRDHFARKGTAEGSGAGGGN